MNTIEVNQMNDRTILSQKHKQAISRGKKGMVFSEEHKAALKVAWIKRKENARREKLVGTL